ncbi:DnaA family protein [Chitinivorax tropicus]|uniref:DnaA family protein n=1 Tax=Chitinivorax tropicus TaxID=714531 RepID=A0A840MNM6_9PROT|nr:DnaA family protein [Chitinivorax tropicus]
MKQLLLDLTPSPPASFDNFVGQANLQALQALRDAVHGRSDERMLYLWGEHGAGRTHLLQATVRAAIELGAKAAYVDCAQLFAPDDSLGELDCVALDNVHHLGADAQVVAFSVFNRLKESRGIFVAAGPLAPSQLPLRADLTTRFGWGLVFQMQPLSDQDKVQALKLHAQARGFMLTDDVCEYLLLRWRRDLTSLVGIIDELDRASLEQQRQITLPLLREVLSAHRFDATGQQTLF